MKKAFLAFLLAALASAQEIRRPTADSDPGAAIPTCNLGGTTSVIASGTGANAYDASGTSTSVAYSENGITGSSTVGASRTTGRLFTNWAAASGAYSSLTLNVNVSCSDDAINAGGECGVDYSTNGGSTWTTLQSDSGSGGWAQATFTANITGASLASLQVRACATGNGGELNVAIAGSGQVTLFDIWTSGVLAPTGCKSCFMPFLQAEAKPRHRRKARFNAKHRAIAASAPPSSRSLRSKQQTSTLKPWPDCERRSRIPALLRRDAATQAQLANEPNGAHSAAD